VLLRHDFAPFVDLGQKNTEISSITDVADVGHDV
jgi:hypothetical protein